MDSISTITNFYADKVLRFENESGEQQLGLNVGWGVFPFHPGEKRRLANHISSDYYRRQRVHLSLRFCLELAGLLYDIYTDRQEITTGLYREGNVYRWQERLTKK